MKNNRFIQGLLRQFSEQTEVVAFSVYDGQKITDITYAQFAEDVLRTAGYFEYKNIHRQHVAIAAPNNYDCLVVFFALLATGNTVVLLNPDLPFEHTLQECQYADAVMICAETMPEGEYPASCGVEWVTFAQLKTENPLPVEAVYDYEVNDTVVMIFTSGTTGKSKVIEYSLGNLLAHLEDLVDIMVLPDKMLFVVPVYHIYGLMAALLRLVNLQTICVGRGMRYLFADVPALNPSYISLVPSVMDSFVKLLKNTKTAEERQRYIGNQLTRISIGGAGVKPEMCRYMMQLGIQIQSAYGMSESTGTGTCCFLTEDNIGTIGKPHGKTQVRIVDGEIQIKSPSVMKGYYKDPEETAKVIVDGWLHTGDIGYCDENGYYYITGRKKSVIILGNGVNVNPEEIEATFGECEAVEECLVYSDGKGICADVFTKAPDIARAFIKEYNETMPMYRQVYKVNYFENPLPKTGSGKIKRKENR